MEFTEHLVGGLVMMAVAGYAFYRMILLWEASKAAPAFVLGAVWIAAVAGAMWFAWPRATALSDAPGAHQRTALVAPRR